jgi:hypothetical protein
LEDGEESEALLQRAELALCTAKRQKGGGGVCLAPPIAAVEAEREQARKAAG